MEIRDVVLKEVIKVWESEAIPPSLQDESPEEQIGNAVARGRRECKRECADILRMLLGALEKPVRTFKRNKNGDTK